MSFDQDFQLMGTEDPLLSVVIAPDGQDEPPDLASLMNNKEIMTEWSQLGQSPPRPSTSRSISREGHVAPHEAPDEAPNILEDEYNKPRKKLVDLTSRNRDTLAYFKPETGVTYLRRDHPIQVLLTQMTPGIRPIYVTLRHSHPGFAQKRIETCGKDTHPKLGECPFEVTGADSNTIYGVWGGHHRAVLMPKPNCKMKGFQIRFLCNTKCSSATLNGKDVTLVVESDDGVQYVKVQVMEQIKCRKRSAPIEDNSSDLRVIKQEEVADLSLQNTQNATVKELRTAYLEFERAKMRNNDKELIMTTQINLCRKIFENPFASM